MSKRQAAARPGEMSTTEVGALLASLLDPRHPATDRDVREFLEAAQQAFAHRAEKQARQLLKMQIGQPADALALTRALVAEIDHVRRNADPTDPVDGHRLRIAQLIEEALAHIDNAMILARWTKKIWAEANRLARAVKRRDGAKNKPKPNQAQLDWAQKQIELGRQGKPTVRQNAIARRLYERAKKEGHNYWPNTEAARAWLNRNPSLLK